MSVRVCLLQNFGKTTNIGGQWAIGRLQIIKNNKKLLLKPFGYKVITIFYTEFTVTICRLERTLGDIWTHLNITTPVSWLWLANHYIKANKIGIVVATTSNTGSQHAPSKLLSSSAYFKSCAVPCDSQCLFTQQFWGALCWMFHRTHCQLRIFLPSLR